MQLIVVLHTLVTAVFTRLNVPALLMLPPTVNVCTALNAPTFRFAPAKTDRFPAIVTVRAVVELPIVSVPEPLFLLLIQPH